MGAVNLFVSLRFCACRFLSFTEGNNSKTETRRFTLYLMLRRKGDAVAAEAASQPTSAARGQCHRRNSDSNSVRASVPVSVGWWSVGTL